MIQILGLRDYVDASGVTKKKHAFFNKGWRAPSVAELFKNIDKYIAEIPEDERWNLYYTAANCLETTGRELREQWVLPIDIDGIDLNKIEEYIPVVCNHLNVPRHSMGIVASGNGLQFLIGLDEPIEDTEYFDAHRQYYKSLCGGIANELYLAGLPSNVDVSVFSTARLLRLPNTKNIKKDKGEKYATLLEGNIEQVPFDLVEASGVPILSYDDTMADSALARLPSADPIGVQDGCDFLKWSKLNPEEVSEPQWYAMLSIIGRLEGGRDLAHEYSRGSSSYSERETDRKLEQSLTASGPRTCSNISSLWDGCVRCPNFQKCKSPITLQSAEYIKTKDTGFYNTVINPQDGTVKRGKPNYEDLMAYFGQRNPFVVTSDGRMLYTYTGKCWEYYTIPYIDSFCEDNFDPKPTAQMCSEFRQKLQRNNIIDGGWFGVDRHINFNNGILRLDDSDFIPHTQNLGFNYVLPFDYNPMDACPRFDQFMKEITCNDEEMELLLLEFMGYALSGGDCTLGNKALILTGDGSNGKSVFMDLMMHLAGEGNYSSLSMGNEINKLENRHQLEGKLFNVSEETPTNAMMDSTVFKALVTGGTIQARKLYCDAYSMKNKTKIIMACNELPPTKDLTHGMFRRLLIVPFNALFSEDVAGFDPLILSKLEKEASGIFNRVIKAFQGFEERKGFTKSKKVARTISNYANENDGGVGSWWDDCVIRDINAVTPSSALYSMYRMNCEQEGEKSLTQRAFSSRLRRERVPADAYISKRIDGKLQRCIKGYRVATGDEE